MSDQRPPLERLVKRPDFERLLRPFLALGLEGAALFDIHGARFAFVQNEGDEGAGPLGGWEQLPPEAQVAASRGSSGVFGFSDWQFHARACYAGADRVGVLLCARLAPEGEDDAHLEQGRKLADALEAVVGSNLQAGFATWVTSEMHLAASESSFVALQERAEELERAVTHLREVDKLKSNFLATVSHELRLSLIHI